MNAAAYLSSRGVDESTATAAAAQFEDGRVWLPWINRDGVETYRTGRSTDGGEPKYLHSKGERPALYASPEAWEAESVALVEGHIDALAVFSTTGIPAFATAGSSLSDAGAEILATKASVVAVPDNDAAGGQWLESVVSKLAGRTDLSVAHIPAPHKDVAELAVADAEAVAAALVSAEEPPWRTSWGAVPEPGTSRPPARLSRTDGRFLLYEGKLHWFQGEPESGKTWLALLACSESLKAGEAALFLDFEDSFAPVKERLEGIGAPLKRFVYRNPTEPISDAARADVRRLMAMKPALVVIDGVSEAMALHGWDPIRNADAASFVHEVLDLFRTNDSTTIVIDHVARGEAGKGSYAYGSQHKRAAIDGASYRFEVLQTFSRAQGGAARIDVAKDRPGHVRSFALNKSRAGVLRIVPNEGRVDVFVDPVNAEGTEDGELSWIANRALAVLDGPNDGGLTYRQINDRLAADGRGPALKRATLQRAVDELIGAKLADGDRSAGGEPSRFWRTEP